MMVKGYDGGSPRMFYCIKFQIADFSPLAIQYSMNAHYNENDQELNWVNTSAIYVHAAYLDLRFAMLSFDWVVTCIT